MKYFSLSSHNVCFNTSENYFKIQAFLAKKKIKPKAVKEYRRNF